MPSSIKKLLRRIVEISIVPLIIFWLVRPHLAPYQKDIRCNALASMATGCLRFIEDVRYLSPIIQTGEIAYFDHTLHDKNIVVLESLTEQGRSYESDYDEFVHGMTVSPDGSHFLLEGLDNVAVYNRRRARTVWHSTQGKFTDAALSPNGQLLAFNPATSADVERKLNIIAIDEESAADFTLTQRDDPDSFLLLSEYELLLANYPDPPFVRNIETGEVARSYSWPPKPRRVEQLTTTIDNFAAITTREIIVWQRATPEPILVRELAGESRNTQIALSPNGEMLAILIRYKTGDPVPIAEDREDQDAREDVESTDRLVLQIWHLEDDKQLVEAEMVQSGYVRGDSVAFSADNRHIAFTTNEGLFVYDLAWLMDNKQP